MHISWQKVGRFLGLHSLLFWPIAPLMGWTRTPLEAIGMFLASAVVVMFIRCDWLKSAPAG